MLPWDKNFLDNIGNIEPKTILCGPDGQDINEISRNLVKRLISETDNKDYSSSELENIASPNFYFLKKDPEKSIIPISELREPRDFLTLSTSNRRLLFIQGGEDIRIDGYNSLLKVAEDTGKDTYIFISTNNISQIPATIKSRFHITRVPRPSTLEVEDYISSKSSNLSKHALYFLSENPSEFDKPIDEISKKMEKYDSYLNNKNIQSKDKDEISCRIADSYSFMNWDTTKSSLILSFVKGYVLIILDGTKMIKFELARTYFLISVKSIISSDI